MWHYFWAHMVYHCARICHRNRTRKCPLATLLTFITVITIVPQLWIIYIRDFYIMFCPFPIYNLVVASIVFTIFMIGFSVIFAMMDPVDRVVKYAFHVFGVADFIFEVLFITYTFKSFVCAISATEMFVVCVLMSLGALATLFYFLVTIPLWIANKWLFKGAILDVQRNDGFCLECVKVWPCLWHI